MQTEIRISCLSTKSVSGYPLFYNKLIHPKSSTSTILIIEETTPYEIRKIIKEYEPTGIILKRGSLAGHTAGILDSSSIVLAVCSDLPAIPIDSYLIIDGVNEKLLIHDNKPSSKTLIKYETRKREKVRNNTFIHNGRKIKIKIDAKSSEEIVAGVKLKIDGIGILRTEWLGFEDKQCPSVSTHYNYYKKISDFCGEHRLNIRLFDIGGDKIPYWAIKDKVKLASPLGLRGIRIIKRFEKAFLNQIEAICKLSLETKVGIVLPMVTDVSEIINFKELLSKLDVTKNTNNIVIGSMVETPSSALNIDEIIKESDFIRIGPGDLTQFTLATLRDYICPEWFNTDRIHSSVIKLIAMVTKQGRIDKKEIDMCLDFEPRKNLVKELLNAGVTTFCVSSSNIQNLRRALDQVLH